MLRNYSRRADQPGRYLLLNEVLSLNAQEWLVIAATTEAVSTFLNEVLSLNAQEFACFCGCRVA